MLLSRFCGLKSTIAFDLEFDTNEDFFSSPFKMKYLAAYLLLALAGNEAPSAADIKAVLSSVGIDAEGDRVEKVISELKDKDLQVVSDTRKRIYIT